MHDLIHKALQKRRHLISESNNLVRLIDGEGDALPGLFLDSFADRWLLSTKNHSIPEPFLRWLHSQPQSCYHKRLDTHEKNSPSWISGPEFTDPFLVTENGARFEISFHSGYSQGIFLDQRNNRAEIRQRMRPGMRLLNTFSYTGAFSIAAALGGAQTTTLDLSQPYLDWAKRNFVHNDLNPADHYFCKGDTFHWFQRFAKQGRLFDAIVLDPPTFSRDEKGKVFRVEKDFGTLAKLATQILAPGGFILCCTNFHQLTPREFESHLLSHIPRSFSAKHSAMPSDFTAAPYLKSVWLEHS